MPDIARASAPASIGNVAVGFDILGQAFDAARDTITAYREDQPGVRLGEVSGVVSSLPADVSRNTALAAAAAVLEAAGNPFGVRLDVDKGVPLSAGMGGSASSAVAAAAAVNGLLPGPFSRLQLLPLAIEGERASSDPPPWDNVVASLFGGLTLIARETPPIVHSVPVPKGVVSILFHPSVKVETRAARALLADVVPMRTAVEHSRRIAAFIAGCAASDEALLRAGLEDILVEPQRAALLPVLAEVKAAAIEAGALGCSFSGSGPSVFAWAMAPQADAVEAAMSWAFTDAGIGAKAYRAPVNSAGVQVEQVGEAVQ